MDQDQVASDTDQSGDSATTTRHSVDFHKGAILCLVSEAYPGVQKAILEAIQNAIDAGAKHVYVGVDQANRRIVVCDDGSGITVEKQQLALATIGHSNKKAEPGTLGQFGLGMVAPVTKCHTMLVYSQPDPDQPVNCWTYREEDIRQQTTELTIPYNTVPSLPVLPEPFTRAANEVRVHNRGAVVRWRTILVMEEASRDSRISHFDPHRLARDITQKLGGGQNAKGTTVLIKFKPTRNRPIERVRVDPQFYTGKKLEPFVVDEVDAGKVTFELYRAKPTSAGVRHGEVKFAAAGKPSAITCQEMQQQLADIEFDDSRLTAALEALGSGYFEGIISATEIELHHNRKSFVHDEVVLWGLCKAIIEWYEKVGSSHIQQERERQQDERYIKLGQASLVRLRTKIEQSPGLSRIFGALGEVMPASAGRSPSQGGSRTNSKGSAEPSVPRKRTVVTSTQHDSTGRPVKSDGFITFVYTVLDDSPDLWTYDRETAQLVLNVAHPLWVSMDDTNGQHTAKNDEYIQRFQEWLVLELITLLVDDPNPHEYELGIEYICRRQEGYILILVLR